MIKLPRPVFGVFAGLGVLFLLAGLIGLDANSIIFGVADMLVGFIGLGWFRKSNRPLSTWESIGVRAATAVMACTFVLLIVFHATPQTTIGVTSFFLAVGVMMYLWFVVTRRSLS